MSHLHRRHRDRREEEIDAAQGKFGPEFDEDQLNKENDQALLISEVHLLLKRTLENDFNGEPGNRDPMQMP